MNAKIFLMIFLCAILCIFVKVSPQEIVKIQLQLDSLKIIKANLEDSLDSVETKIKNLEQELLKIQVANDTTKGIIVNLASDGYLKAEPTVITDILMKLPRGTQVIVVAYKDSYFKAKIGEQIGYIHEMFFPSNGDLSRLSNYSAKFTTTPNTSSTSTSKSYNSSNTSGTNSDARTIYTGPRGGKYYINSKGKKVYIKKN